MYYFLCLLILQYLKLIIKGLRKGLHVCYIYAGLTRIFEVCCRADSNIELIVLNYQSKSIEKILYIFGSYSKLNHFL